MSVADMTGAAATAVGDRAGRLLESACQIDALRCQDTAAALGRLSESGFANASPTCGPVRQHELSRRMPVARLASANCLRRASAGANHFGTRRSITYGDKVRDFEADA